MFAAIEETAASRLDHFDRSIDSSRRPVGKMNAKMLEAALTADASKVVIGHGQVKSQRVAYARRPHKDNVAISKLLFHAERLDIEGDRARKVSYEEMDMTDPNRSQGSSCAPRPCIPARR
jgi:hypothetical protein